MGKQPYPGIDSKFSKLLRSDFFRLLLLAWVSVSAIVAVAGPFGTFDAMRFDMRVLYWAAIVGFGYGAGALVFAIVQSRFAKASAAVRWVLTIASCAIVICTIVWLISLAAIQLTGGEMTKLAPLMGYVLMITVGVDRSLAYFRQLARATPPKVLWNVGVAPPRARLAERLQNADAQIIRLASRDHFVDVVTDKGTETLRMRFSDAVNEMDPIQGHCTQRSHWVSLAYIDGPEREGTRMYLRLTNGDRVPVGGKYRDELERAGLLEMRVREAA